MHAVTGTQCAGCLCVCAAWCINTNRENQSSRREVSFCLCHVRFRYLLKITLRVSQCCSYSPAGVPRHCQAEGTSAPSFSLTHGSQPTLQGARRL